VSVEFWPGIIVFCPHVETDDAAVLLPTGPDQDMCGVCGEPLADHEIRMFTDDDELVDVRTGERA